MRKAFLILSIFCLIGCATVNIPNYIIDKNPYKSTYYSSFEKVSEAVTNTLKDFGWEIAGRTKPEVYEQDPQIDVLDKQIMLFTNSRQTPFFLGTRYSKINVHLTKINESTTETEIRYIAITSIFFKTFESYKKDNYVNRLFKTIEEKL